jgi:hypothetical protein
MVCYETVVQDLYEDVLDKATIEEFEARERTGQVSFISAEDMLKQFA